jgi:hypothetical protein
MVMYWVWPLFGMSCHVICCLHCSSRRILWTSTWLLSCLLWLQHFLHMDSLNNHYKVLSWNVRGLNSIAKQEDVKQVVNVHKPDLICLQETKMSTISIAMVRSFLDYDYENNFLFLPSVGASGGIILAARDSFLHLSNPTTTRHTISASILDCKHNITWRITGVYGPQGGMEKKMFIRELRHLKPSAGPHWLYLEILTLFTRLGIKMQVA